jgi:hypothetical protein
MKSTELVKTAGNQAIKYGSAALGAGLGTLVANKLPVPSIGNEMVSGHLKKIVPGLSVMIIAYLIGAKIKHEASEAGAIGMGLAGAANILKNYWPDAAKFITLNGGMGAPTIDMQENSSGTYQMINGLGLPPQNNYQLIN